MSLRLEYGSGRAVEFDLPPGREAVLCGPPAGRTLADPAAVVAAALAEPLDYPPLSLATVPGDLVAIVVEEGLPQAPAVVAGVVQALLGGGVEPCNILIVETQSALARRALDPRSTLPPDIAAEVQRVIHDPADQNELCYLAVNDTGEPIYLNRAICDADLVVPIGCMRPRLAYGYRGPYSGIYPAFSDRPAQERLLQPRRLNREADAAAMAAAAWNDAEFAAEDGPRKRSKKRKAGGLSAAAKTARAKEAAEKSPTQQADEIGWLLGSRLVIQVVPSPSGDLVAVLCGDVEAVTKRGQELCDELWAPHVPGRFGLVVSAIVGDASQQTWENVAKALAAARRVVADEGAIALCTELAAPPGQSLMRLAEARDLESALAQVDEDHASDSTAASQLARALQAGPVYLLSRLKPEVVEALGMAPVESAEQLGRLGARFDSCLLVSGAQYAAPRLGDESTRDES